MIDSIEIKEPLQSHLNLTQKIVEQNQTIIDINMQIISSLVNPIIMIHETKRETK